MMICSYITVTLLIYYQIVISLLFISVSTPAEARTKAGGAGANHLLPLTIILMRIRSRYGDKVTS